MVPFLLTFGFLVGATPLRVTNLSILHRLFKVLSNLRSSVAVSVRKLWRTLQATTQQDGRRSRYLLLLIYISCFLSSRTLFSSFFFFFLLFHYYYCCLLFNNVIMMMLYIFFLVNFKHHAI